MEFQVDGWGGVAPSLLGDSLEGGWGVACAARQLQERVYGERTPGGSLERRVAGRPTWRHTMAPQWLLAPPPLGRDAQQS